MGTMTQAIKKKPIPMLTWAHQGIIKGEPKKATMLFQSKEMAPNPRPLAPVIWERTRLSGLIQQIQAMEETTGKRKPGIHWYTNMQKVATKKNLKRDH